MVLGRLGWSFGPNEMGPSFWRESPCRMSPASSHENNYVSNRRHRRLFLRQIGTVISILLFLWPPTTNTIMDPRWRPFPPHQPAFCPTCSSPHFPFCPPPPPMPIPAPAQPTSSLHRPLIPPPPPPYPYNHEIPYQSHGNHHAYRTPYPGAEGDGNLRKRMRMDDPLGIHHQDFHDVERRSKLIREHGSGPGVGNGNGCGLAYAANPGSYPYHGSNGDYSLPDGRTQIFQWGTVYPDPRGEFPPEMSRYCGGNVVGGGGGRHYSFDPTRPPLPPSPPPPLPSHPPMRSLMPNGRGYPQPIERTSGALFPVDSNVSTASPSVYYPTRQVPSTPAVFAKEVCESIQVL